MSGTLSHLPSDIIRQLLIDLMLGTDGTLDDWPIYTTASPNTPSDVIILFQTEGKFQGRDMFSGAIQGHYGINIAVRGEDIETTGDKAQDIADAMDSTVDRDIVSMTSPINTYQIEAITRTSDPLHVGKEQPEGRWELFSINLIVAMYQAS